jgi:hypothetical protein
VFQQKPVFLENKIAPVPVSAHGVHDKHILSVRLSKVLSRTHAYPAGGAVVAVTQFKHSAILSELCPERLHGMQNFHPAIANWNGC